MDVSRDADIYNFFLLGMSNTPEKDLGQKKILQFSTVGLFLKQADSCSRPFLPLSTLRYSTQTSQWLFISEILYDLDCVGEKADIILQITQSLWKSLTHTGKKGEL